MENKSAKNLGGKTAGFIPFKMMIPKPFRQDDSLWRKWEEEGSKHFDEEHEGMK